MSYKPDEATLMAYLYGELEGTDKDNVLQYLQENPDADKEFQEMKDTLKIMDHVHDKEVIAPPVLAEENLHIGYWKSTAFKTVASIAASLLLLLVAGRLIGPDIQYADGELRISFGKLKPIREVASPVAEMTTEEVQQMINNSLALSVATMDAKWSENQLKLNASIHSSLVQNTRKVDNLVKNTSHASELQLRSYVAGLQTENLRLIKDYFQLSSKEQNDYVENLLIGFSKYMQEQRAQDLVLVQDRFNNLEKNSDQFKQETEQLLASIISNTKPKQSSY